VTSQRLRAFRSDLRRAIAARRRPLAALCAAAAVGSGISAARPSPDPTTPVLVSASDLAAGTVLAEGDLTTVAWRSDHVPDGALDAGEPPLGQTIAAPMRAGEPLTDIRLLQPGLLAGHPPGTVLTTIRTADPATMGIVHVGDAVDVVGADPQGRTPAVVLGRSVPVVSVLEGAADAMPGGEGPVLVVAVDESTAVRLADAAVRLQLSVLVG